MDFDQRDYFFQMQQMRQLPYAMMYSYPDLYMNEVETQRDMEYLQQMYPTDAKRMQRKVTEACDRMDYEGSMMYDEYPDRVSMLLICDRIAAELGREDAENAAREAASDTVQEELSGTQMPPRPMAPPSPPPPMDAGRRSLLEVLLYNEMHRRRCKRRQCRRFW